MAWTCASERGNPTKEGHQNGRGNLRFSLELIQASFPELCMPIFHSFPLFLFPPFFIACPEAVQEASAQRILEYR